MSTIKFNTLLFLFVPFIINAQTVLVTDFGCNSADATDCIQKAFDSGANKVIIPNNGAKYIVRPLFVKSNQEIFIERGVEIEAKKGEYKNIRDALLNIVGVKNVSVIGYGATIRMLKEDYQNTSLYQHSEWRHAINIDVKNNITTENITIKGLWIEKSGGDGILVGGESGYPDFRPYQATNILIQDVVCSDNHRQGISVTGADKLKIINTVLKDTKGTPPQAGIDFEPDWSRLNEIEMTNCYVANNRVSGIELFLYRPAWKGLSDISLKFKHCYVDSDAGMQGLGLNIRHNVDNGVNGLISFEDCDFKNNTIYSTALISDFSALKAKLKFFNCGFEQLNSNGKVIEMSTDKTDIKANMTFGGIGFTNCWVNDRNNRDALTFTDEAATGKGISDISGSIQINNTQGGKINLGSIKNNVSLSVVENKNNYPNISFQSPKSLDIIEGGASFKFSINSNDPGVGVNNGQGIEQVKLTIRYESTVVAEVIDKSAPYEINGNTLGWKEGVYLVVAEALTSKGATKALKALPFRVFNKSNITGTIESLINDSYSLYPNPANKELYIRDAKIGADLEISDMGGKILIKEKIEDTNNRLDVSALKSGFYILKINNNVKKLIVE